MLPQKIIQSQQKRVLNLLMSPNPDGYTRMQIARCLGIERATICRRVAELRDLGLVRVVKKDLDPLTHELATFLTANKDVLNTLQHQEEPQQEETGRLF